MNEQNTKIEILISAFAYSLVSMNETFYLRKHDLKVIGVHIFDHALVSDCKSEYDSGLSKEEERDIKQAIIANEKNYDTHILIPRLTHEQRFTIISDFMDLTRSYTEKLQHNRNALLKSSENYNAKFYKQGIKPGIEMEYLTNEIDDEDFKSKWTEFYRNKTKAIALEWLENEKKMLQKNV